MKYIMVSEIQRNQKSILCIIRSFVLNEHLYFLFLILVNYIFSIWADISITKHHKIRFYHLEKLNLYVL
jgi:hypothetical protein